MQAFINAHPDQFNSTGAKDISGALGGDANNNGNLDLNNKADKSGTEVKDTVGPYKLSWSSYIIIQIFLLANVLAIAAVVWFLVL